MIAGESEVIHEAPGKKRRTNCRGKANFTEGGKKTPFLCR